MDLQLISLKTLLVIELLVLKLFPTETINIKKVGYVHAASDISCYQLQRGDILFSNINSIEHLGKNALFTEDL